MATAAGYDDRSEDIEIQNEITADENNTENENSESDGGVLRRIMSLFRKKKKNTLKRESPVEKKSWWSRLKFRGEQNGDDNGSTSFSKGKVSGWISRMFSRNPEIPNKVNVVASCSSSASSLLSFSSSSTNPELVRMWTQRMTVCVNRASHSYDPVTFKPSKKRSRNHQFKPFLYHSHERSFPLYALLPLRERPVVMGCFLRSKGRKYHVVEDLLALTNTNYYWGNVHRYEADRMLLGMPSGTFLVRDSFEGHLFTVSVQKNNQTFHVKIEQDFAKYTLDADNPKVYAAETICELIEYYRQPHPELPYSPHRFITEPFEPIFTEPLERPFAFSLKHICRAVICASHTYDRIGRLKIPKLLKVYLREFRYKTKGDLTWGKNTRL